MVTGIPPNNWHLVLSPGICIDIVPLRGNTYCLRTYGFNDSNKGFLKDNLTLWMERPFIKWLANRGLSIKAIGLEPACDIFDAPIYPILTLPEFSEELINWIIAETPLPDKRIRDYWLRLKKISARNIMQQANLEACTKSVYKDKFKSYDINLPETASQFDLQVTAQILASQKYSPKSPPMQFKNSANNIMLSHNFMFQSKLAFLNKKPNLSLKLATKAFDCLHDAITRKFKNKPVKPSRNVVEDQIVWARSPVRLDFAGGWTDTPPYCLEHGGKVVNIAVNLNGQPPIQVFGRFTKKNSITLHSIDLGVTQEITNYNELANYRTLNNAFSLSKAALALAGLEPQFHDGKTYPSLKKQLSDELGAGIEISMVCAIPKGSGLGTSSILGATLLGLLNDMLGLNWSLDEIFERTMALEQMLTSGGGWQDQIGGITPGIKFITTMPGLFQQPVLRWLPEKIIKEAFASKLMQLYYTGLTRTAHDILGEIVKSIFLNSSRSLSILNAIGKNADFAVDAVQRGDWYSIREVIRRSWELNQLLDSGTNPPQMFPILNRLNKFDATYKLLGAGGGGYLLILAPDRDASFKIRESLTSLPPNPSARFVEAEISRTGMEITRS